MNISQTGATLSGSYSSLTGSVTEVGFRWGTSSGNLSNTATGTLNGTSFSASLSGLVAGTTYYYQAYAKVQGTGDKSSSVQTFTGDVNQFTTEAEEVGGLLELPARRDPSEASVGKVALVRSRWRGIRPLRRTGAL